MLIKQDFTNLLEQEIERMERLIDAIELEIEERKHLDDDFKTSDSPKLSPLEFAINLKTIANLEAELRSKNDALLKVKEKKMFDDAERGEDYEVYKKRRDEVLSSIEKVEDVHILSYLRYAETELISYEKEEKKEPIVYYFNTIRQTLEDLEII